MQLPLQVLSGASTKSFGLEKKMIEPKFVNYYRCPFDGTEWTDVWDCCCNDMCPLCEHKDIEPHDSLELADTH
jgi:hypothetical protein